MVIFSAFVLGLLGSFHCIAMCGPIALSLPVQTNSKAAFIYGRIIYNSGRIITYALLGSISGFVGNRIFLYGFQQSISIVIGCFIIVFLVLKLTSNRILHKFDFINKLFYNFKNLFHRFYSKRSFYSMLMIGIMNGFLPCGFVYIALSGALISGEVVSGSAYMILFGMGTIPMMLSVSLFGNYLNINVRQKINKLIPAFTLLLGILFILRGLNLGIPYISPKFEKVNTTVEEVICH